MIIHSTYDTIFCNKICNNTSFDLGFNLGSSSNISISNNYWCTTDSSIIASHIYDGYDNINYGLAFFMPIDTSGCYLTPYSGCNLIVSANVTNASCGSCSNGSATAVITNGMAPYVYTWYTSPVQTAATATALAPGTYSLCVSDAIGCTACTYSIHVDSVNCTGFTISTYTNDASCLLCTDGSALVVATGGATPYSYTWYTSPIQTTDTAVGLGIGTYAVCVVDHFGCAVCDSVTIGPPPCSAYFNLYPDTIPHRYILVNMASGVLPLTYDWNWGDNSTHDTSPNPSHTYASPGTYTICLTITDSVGCTNTYCGSYYLLRTQNTMVYVNVVSLTGIKEIITSNKITVFPNPANSSLNIHQTFTSPNEQVIITDILGHEVYKAPLTGIDNAIELSKWSNGIYFYEVNGHRGKVVKN